MHFVWRAVDKDAMEQLVFKPLFHSIHSVGDKALARVILASLVSIIQPGLPTAIQ